MAILLDNPPILSIHGRESRVLPSLRKGAWFVACVKSNQDRSFASEMIARKQSIFIALSQSTVKSSGRFYDGQKPIFPGYVFFHGDQESRIAALETKRTFSIIPSEDIYQQRIHLQLAQVYRILTQSPQEVAVFQGKVPGKQCRITDGRLKGTTGTIRSLEKGEVILNIDVLGQGILVTINPDQLEVLA